MNGDAPLNAGSCVLVVDRMAESREVLRMALARLGVRIVEAPLAGDALTMARLHQPNVMVVDLESSEVTDQCAVEFAGLAEDNGSTVIFLGNELRAHGISKCHRGPHCDFIAKPYHYRPLVLKIEKSLRQRHARAA